VYITCVYVDYIRSLELVYVHTFTSTIHACMHVYVGELNYVSSYVATS